jgi:hypothetical protein
MGNIWVKEKYMIARWRYIISNISNGKIIINFAKALMEQHTIPTPR